MVDNTNEEVIKMLVGICDDDKIIRKRIRHICEQVLNEKCMEIRIIEFTNGREVIDNEKKIELLILDIEMPLLDGIKVKECFQQMGEETLIIFVTCHVDQIREAFGKNVFDFVDKGRISDQLADVIGKAIMLHFQSIIIEAIGNRNSICYINSRDILYAQASGNYINIFLKNNKMVYLRKTLRSLEGVLKHFDFLRVSRINLVNLRWVRSVDGNEIIIFDENDKKIKIVISVRNQKKVNNAYREYAKKIARYYGCE